MIEHLFENPVTRILISVLLGFGLATLFRKVCKDNKCVVINSPPIEDLEKYYYKIKDDCFKYTPYPADCSEKTQEDFRLR